MRRRSSHWTVLTVFLLGLAIAACQEVPMAPLGEPFELDAGAAVRITGTELHLRFARVESDNRCPEGVQCITAGEAVVGFEASAGSGDTEWVLLHLRGGSAPDSSSASTVGPYRVSLRALEPAPLGGIRADSTAYTATVLVTR